MTSIVLPESLTRIENSAFGDCDSLVSVTSLSSVPPFSYRDAFSSKALSYGTLYVPSGSLEAYQEAQVWQNFSRIVELDPTGIGEVATDGTVSVSAGRDGILVVEGAAGPVEVYDAKGVLVVRIDAGGSTTEVPLPGGGLYLVKAGGKTVKVMAD